MNRFTSSPNFQLKQKKYMAFQTFNFLITNQINHLQLSSIGIRVQELKIHGKPLRKLVDISRLRKSPRLLDYYLYNIQNQSFHDWSFLFRQQLRHFQSSPVISTFWRSTLYWIFWKISFCAFKLTQNIWEYSLFSRYMKCFKFEFINWFTMQMWIF